MSLARTVGKGFAWTTFSSIAVRAIVLFNLFVVLHHLSLYEYGLAELVFSTVSLLSLLMLPGLASPVLADLSADRSKERYGSMRTLFHQYLGLTCLLGIAAWSILFFGASTLVELLLNNPSIAEYVQIVAFLFLIAPLRSVAIMLANVELRFGDVALYSVVEEGAKLLYLLLFFFGLDAGIQGVFYAAVLSQATAFLLFLPRTWSAYRPLLHAVAEGNRRLLTIVSGHRAWAIANSYVNSLVAPLQLWTIRLILGTEAVALYAFAHGVYIQVASLLSLPNVLSPILPRYRDRLSELLRLLRTSIKVQAAFAIMLLVGVELATPMLGLLFPKYLPALPLTHVLILSLIPAGINAMYTPVFNALKKQRSFFASMLVKLGLTALAFPISILLLGLWGMPAALLVVTVGSLLERNWRLSRHLHSPVLRFSDLVTVDTRERDYMRVLLTKMPLGQFLLRVLPSKFRS